MKKNIFYYSFLLLFILNPILSCAKLNLASSLTEKPEEGDGDSYMFKRSDKKIVSKMVAANRDKKNIKRRRTKKRYSSDCSYKKKYKTGKLQESIADFGRLKRGMWSSEAAESLQYFPKDIFGYYPDWVAAVELGIINPLGTLDSLIPEEKEYQPDTLMIVKSPLRNNICFPHWVHTYWLRCNNCHPEIFIAKNNANPISMTKIIKGQFCGRCHGKVAFHVANNCHRCHNTPK